MTIQQKLNPNELRQLFLSFMERYGATIVPSSSLLPENDPTTLFNGSGMQPMIPYLLGDKHPAGNHITNVQKCLRTNDIDEVGDTSHLTFFEMIGRWEFGGDPKSYKRQQIVPMWDWQVGELGLDPRHLYVTVYQGNETLGFQRDEDAIAIWSELFHGVGIDPVVETDPWTYGASRGGRIFVYDEKENWWSRAGVPDNMPVGEPGGPDSEMFFDFEPKGDPLDHPATETSRFLEIGNNVFMAYKKTDSGFVPLNNPNIDYGGGLERIAAAVNGHADIYRTAFFTNTMLKLSNISGQTYEDHIREFRIILDHTRAATFLINDGAVPSNVDAGYITRRLMRRAIRTARKIGINQPFMSELATIYIDEATAYPELSKQKQFILSTIKAEEEQFQKTLQKGELEMERYLERHAAMTGEDAFHFYETFGFPWELTQEFLGEKGIALTDPDGFTRAANQHAEKSRTAAAGKFQGGLADHSHVTTSLHTVAHLMLEGLRKTLGDHVHQRGCNITAERVRFDFSQDQKLTEEQIRSVEQYVNDAIAADALISVTEMSKQQARDEGVEGSFWEKYPDIVKIYMMQDDTGHIWSRELCGGPHIERTGQLAELGRFQIAKEESISAGTRRIKAVMAS